MTTSDYLTQLQALDESITNKNEITDISWINIKEAEEIMFYFPDGVQNLLEKRLVAPYYFQTL